MLTIPANVETLLKSKSMLGENRPHWKVTISSSSSDYAIEDVREIVIEKQMYQAQQCQLIIDNKEGKYAPDRSGDWEHVLWPNNTVKVEFGYTSTESNALAFTGYIDSLTMRHLTDVGAVAVVSARDYYKLALDQIVSSGGGDYTWTFEDATLEDIFYDLAVAAGWSTESITTQPSDVEVDSKTFERESYADAFLWLGEMAGFETIVDNDGGLQFRFAADRQPEVVDERVRLDGTAWTTLDQVYLVGGSERVYESSEFGGTLYTTSAAYDVEYGDPARIARLSTDSLIADGSTVFVTYVYAAWSFEVGEDIIRLSYTIDDQDIYKDVLVRGTGVSAKVDANLSAYWRLPAGKVRVVEASEITDADSCRVIGEQIARRSAQRARFAEFACPGNPWLEVGDCIRIVEGTTTVSEIYRIVGLEHRFDHGGYITQIQAYYYGYTPAPEGVV